MKPIRLMAALASPLGVCAAQAQVFSEPALDALYRDTRFVELDRIAQQRLAARPDDRQAVLAVALVSQQGKGTAAQRLAAIARAEACVERQPQAAECHHALGSTLGIQAMNEGMLKMASSVGRVRSALAEAVALAPQWYPARSALVSFYVMAPGLMGGSRDKAVATARAASTPEQAQALMAVVAIADEKPDAALAAVQGIRRGTDTGLDDDLRNIGHNAGLALLNAGQGAKARGWFERA